MACASAVESFGGGGLFSMLCSLLGAKPSPVVCQWSATRISLRGAVEGGGMITGMCFNP